MILCLRQLGMVYEKHMRTRLIINPQLAMETQQLTSIHQNKRGYIECQIWHLIHEEISHLHFLKKIQCNTEEDMVSNIDTACMVREPSHSSLSSCLPTAEHCWCYRLHCYTLWKPCNYLQPC